MNLDLDLPDPDDTQGAPSPAHAGDPDIKEIFADARELPPAEREAFVRLRCGGNEEAVRAVETLLGAHDQAGRFLAGATQDTAPGDAAIGQRIGRYKLLQSIGEGGFGTVYLAEQERPVRRRVALKIIKLGMDTKQVIARFEAERQALAMMDHPNIAKVLDAGATDTGRPYFVMELVRGVPITDYCDTNNLPVPERLELFVAVCQAVQHAHQKGIIHRDLKPSNVMIAMADGRPIPKVIDFGIAKATNQQLTEKTIFTEFRQMIGTPQYMSPEQAEMAGIDIDTRSDVYSLGVMLYELLVGSTPFDPEQLRSKAYGEMQRIIREVDPPRPSTRLSTLAKTLPAIAAHRRVEPAKLGQIIKGELDWIVMRAMEKDRTRRYETANGLAADLRRYLAGEAVMAAPASRSYQFRKLVRRNKGPVAAAGTIAAVLLLGLGAATYGLRAAKIERDHARRAEADAKVDRDTARAAQAAAQDSAKVARLDTARAQATTAFLQEMLGSADPNTGLGKDARVRQVLDRSAALLRSGHLQAQPEIEVVARTTLGKTYLGLGLFREAEEHLRVAWQLNRVLHGDQSLEVADNIDTLALAVFYHDHFVDAGDLWQQSLAIRQKLLPHDHLAIADNLMRLAWVAFKNGFLIEARESGAQAIWMVRRLPDADPLRGAEILSEAAHVLGWSGNWKGIPELQREVINIQRKHYNGDTPQVCETLHRLGSALAATGDPAGAVAVYRENLALQRKLLGEDHRAVALTLCRLGPALAMVHDYPAAESTLREAFDLWDRALPDDPMQLDGARGLLSIMFLRGETQEAERFFTARYAALRARPQPYPELETAVAADMRDFYAQLGRGDDSARWAAEARDSYRRGFEVAIQRSTVAIAADAGDAAAYKARATAYACTARYRQAADDYAKVNELRPGEHYPWYYRACLLALLRDSAAYQAHCAAMLAAFGNVPTNFIQDRTAKSCLLLPPPAMPVLPDQSARLLALTERACASVPAESGLGHWFQIARGMALYRRGDFSSAAAALELARANDNGERELQIEADFYLALCLKGMGNQNAARAALKRAESSMSDASSSPSDTTSANLDNLICLIAQRESEEAFGNAQSSK